MDNTQKMDQLLAKAVDNIVLMAWTLYNDYMKKGFTELQAFELVKAYVHGVAGGKLM